MAALTSCANRCHLNVVPSKSLKRILLNCSRLSMQPRPRHAKIIKEYALLGRGWLNAQTTLFAVILALVTIFVTAEFDSCTEPFGCFPNKSDFVHPIYRPINLPPESAIKVNTTFYLYAEWLSMHSQSAKLPSRCSGGSLKLDYFHKPCIFTTDDLLHVEQLGVALKSIAQLNKNWKPNKVNWWTAVVVHGFLDSLKDSSWMSSIKNGLLVSSLERSYGVVVLVDWTGGNGIPYVQATANTRLIGVQIAYFLRQLHQHLHTNIQLSHIIGHSLGSHIAGYVGQQFTSAKLGRITALDPAGPNFEGMPESVRIDHGDALLVDAIHTNAKPLHQLGYGMLQPVGHMDFYPNGGIDQPGCDISILPTALTQIMSNPDNLMSNFGHIAQLMTCSHLRAIDYFLESLSVTTCQFVSQACDTWLHYLDEQCPSNVSSKGNAQMGFQAYEWAQQIDQNLTNSTAARKSAKFYLETNRQSPFCKKMSFMQ